MNKGTLGEPREVSRAFEVRRFVRRTYGPFGTLRLHRAAFGLDILRAPINVALAPVFLLCRLLALFAGLAGRRSASLWLSSRRVTLKTAVAAEVERRLRDFLEDLKEAGLGTVATPAAIDRAVNDYVGVRSAVAEISTLLVVVTAGMLIFGTATPGVVSLTGPVSDFVGRSSAIADFPLGSRLGRMWYGVFPIHLPVWFVVVTGLILAMAGSLVTTFAGLIADPIQAVIGAHRRRLLRLLERLDRSAGDDLAPHLAREHVAARLGDVADAGVSLIRFLRP